MRGDNKMSFEKQMDIYETEPTRGCSGCPQNDAPTNQAKYGEQAAEQRRNTNKGSASTCSC